MGLTGDLSKLKVGDLFQTLEGSRQTGVLRVWRQGEARELFFGPRGVTLLHLATLCTDRLAQRFLNAGEIHRDDVESAKRHAETHGSTFGQVLVQRNLVQSEDVERAVQEQAEELLYDMFAWAEGNFEFFDDQKPDTNALGPYQLSPLPIGPALLEGARRLDEWAEIERQVPDRGEVFVAAVLGASQRAQLSQNEREVFEAIDGRSDMRVVADRTLGSLFDTAKTVAILADRELVRLATLDELVQSAELEYGQGRRENARTLLDLAVARRAPRLRRNLDQIARLYEAMGEKERACDLRSFVAGQLIASEHYEDAREILHKILELAPEHVSTHKRLLQVLDEIESDSAAAFTQRVRVVEILTALRDNEADARHVCGMLTAVPPRDADLVRRGAQAANKAGAKECALSLLHFAAEIDREDGHRLRLAETYRDILKLDRSNKEIAHALRHLLLSQKARRRRRVLIASLVFLVLAAGSWWLTAFWNAANAASLLQQAEELGRTDAPAALVALTDLDERFSGSIGAGEAIESASRLRQSLQRRLSEEQRRREEDAQRLLSGRLAEAGGLVDAMRFAEALPIYREILAKPIAKAEQETIRFRIQSVLESYVEWDSRMQAQLAKTTPEFLARLSAKEIEALRTELARELARVDEASLVGLKDALKDHVISKVLARKEAPVDEAFFTRIGTLHVKGTLLEEELAKRIDAYSRTDELERLLGDASKAERENRWSSAAELYRLLAQSSIESGLQQQFLDQAQRLEAIVKHLDDISSATERRDFGAAVTAYHTLVDEHPDLDLRGRIRLPFLLRSIPAGAEVHEGSQLLGHTPLPVEFDPFRASTLIVKTPGFEPEVLQLNGFDRGDATLVLRTIPLWRSPGEGAIDSPPFEHAGIYYLADRGGHVRAFDPARRELLFDRNLSSEMGGLRGAPFKTPSGLCAVSWEGRLLSFDARTGEPGEEAELPGEGTLIGPVASGRRLWHARGAELHVRDLETAGAAAARTLEHPALLLRAFDDDAIVAQQGGRIERHAAGSKRSTWWFESRTSILHCLIAGSDAWIFGADGAIVRLDLERGTETARWKIAAAPAQEPFCSGDRLYIPMTRELLALDAVDGREILRWPLENLQITAAPALDAEKGRVVLATDKGLEVLELDKPRTAWRYPTSAKVAVPPVVTQSGLLIVLATGTLELLPRR